MGDRFRLRAIKFILRFGGVVTVTAFGAMLLPLDWMAATHRWLGLGELPRAPVVEYLARSIAALYGFHGVLLLIVSGDPIRYRAIVQYIAWLNMLFGGMLVVIDAAAGLPMMWTLMEGPPIAAIGLTLALLNRGRTGETGERVKR